MGQLASCYLVLHNQPLESTHEIQTIVQSFRSTIIQFGISMSVEAEP
jgi:hypothetical protein